MAQMHNTGSQTHVRHLGVHSGKPMGMRGVKRRNTNHREAFTNRIHKVISRIQIRIENFMCSSVRSNQPPHPVRRRKPPQLPFNAPIDGDAMQGYWTVAGATTACNAADDFDKIATFSRTVRLIIGVAAFALGILVGAGVAAWVIPPV
jgi:hypothetical protein